MTTVVTVVYKFILYSSNFKESLKFELVWSSTFQFLRDKKGRPSH